MFTIEQWRGPDGQYAVRFLFDGEPLATYALTRKATDEELRKMLDIYAELTGKAIEEAILYGAEGRRK